MDHMFVILHYYIASYSESIFIIRQVFISNTLQNNSRNQIKILSFRINNEFEFTILRHEYTADHA